MCGFGEERGMKLLRALLAIIAILGWSATAFAQMCTVPDSLQEPRAEFPPPGEAKNVPVTGHILALSWSPQFCKEHDDSKFDSQCKAKEKFGFILHGLWPDGAGRENPQWCKRVGAVPKEVVRQAYCATPSVNLLQHEWAKHGSCVEPDAARYFRAATSLYGALKWPDMNKLSRGPLDVGGFTDAFTAANPGLKGDMIRVSVTPLGWLEEVRLCLDRTYHPVRCPRDIGGAGANTKLKIWRTG
jgi:ribonuclease T2